MPGAAGADHLVMRGILLAAGIAGHRLRDALGVLIDRLHAPEAAAGQHRRLQSAAGGRAASSAGGGMATAGSAACTRAA